MRKVQNSNQWKNVARELPILIYFRLCIHMETTDKKLTEKAMVLFYKLKAVSNILLQNKLKLRI